MTSRNNSSAPFAYNNINSSSNADNSATDATQMTVCSECGHHVPTANMTIHQARACTARKQPAQQLQQQRQEEGQPAETISSVAQRQRSSGEDEHHTRIVSHDDDIDDIDDGVEAMSIDDSTSSVGLNSMSIADEVTTEPYRDRREHRARLDSVIAQARTRTAALARPYARAVPSSPPRSIDTYSASLPSARVFDSPIMRPEQEIVMVDDDDDDDVEAIDFDDVIELDRENRNFGGKTSNADAIPANWTCPRCTLINAGQANRCDACEAPNPHRRRSRRHTSTRIRPPDATIRQQLIMDEMADQFGDDRNDRMIVPVQQQSSATPLPENLPWASSGALLGGVLGAAGAYIHGRSVSSGALSGAFRGAVTGATLQAVRDVITVEQDEAQQAPQQEAESLTASQQARLARAERQRRRLPVVEGRPSATRRSNSMNVPVHAPIVSRFMRRRESNGTRPTVVTSSARARANRDGTDNDDNEFFPLVVGNMRGYDDPMVAFLMQRVLEGGLVAGGGGGGRSFIYRVPNVDGMSYDQLLQAFGDGSENLAADPVQISTLPTFKVKDPSSLHENKAKCSICLENFAAGDVVKTMPCWHDFHEQCLDTWLNTNGNCPICKHRLTDNEVE